VVELHGIMKMLDAEYWIFVVGGQKTEKASRAACHGGFQKPFEVRKPLLGFY
jgi:hypothetical protein